MPQQMHNRQSTRLKGYDYSQEGLYFITICTHDRQCLFGHIVGAENFPPKMILNDAGKIANECWLEIPNHFPNAVLHEHIIMPNHVHGIIELKSIDVGTRHGVGTRHVVSIDDIPIDDVGTRHVVSLQDNPDISVGASHVMPLPLTPRENKFSQPIPGSISVIIQQYKSSVKRWCNKNGHEYFKWQSRFHDHIIRNQQSYETIAAYIINNPAKWKDDKFYK